MIHLEKYNIVNKDTTNLIVTSLENDLKYIFVNRKYLRFAKSIFKHKHPKLTYRTIRKNCSKKNKFK